MERVTISVELGLWPFCRRRYEYLLPAFAFDSSSDRSGTQGGAGLDTAAQQQPAPPAGAPQAEGQSPAEGVPSPAGGRGDFVLDGVRLERLNGILAQFKGTHSFHNYTVKVAPQPRSMGSFWQATWGPVCKHPFEAASELITLSAGFALLYLIAIPSDCGVLSVTFACTKVPASSGAGQGCCGIKCPTVPSTLGATGSEALCDCTAPCDVARRFGSGSRA